MVILSHASINTSTIQIARSCLCEICFQIPSRGAIWLHLCATPKGVAFLAVLVKNFSHFSLKQGMVFLHSKREFGYVFFRRSYVFIILDKTIRKSPS